MAAGGGGLSVKADCSMDSYYSLGPAGRQQHFLSITWLERPRLPHSCTDGGVGVGGAASQRSALDSYIGPSGLQRPAQRGLTQFPEFSAFGRSLRSS